jgi:hypothetical protein
MATPTNSDEQQQQQQQQQQIFDALDPSSYHVKFNDDNRNSSPRTNSLIQDDISTVSKQG